MEGSRKRPLEIKIEETPYFKIRSLLKDLRPHFIEVLKTPEFLNCKAADEIREGMKVMMELYKELTPVSAKLQKCESAPSFSSGDDVLDEKKTLEKQNDEKGDQTRGTYIIGGSAIGWNFITFLGTTAVYYGQTKEAYRAANPASD